METLFFSLVIVGLCFLGLGCSTFFFGKSSDRKPCGSVPTVKRDDDDCPSRTMGLCPVQDTSGTVKLVNQMRISYPKEEIR